VDGLGWLAAVIEPTGMLAFEWFERALEERTVRLCELDDPAFDELRSDRRFEALMQTVGLPS